MKIFEKFGVKPKIATDLLYTVGSMVVMQCALQIVIYPYINRHAGSEVLGNTVFYMEIVYILSIAIGQALCNIRLTMMRKYDYKNGDYNYILRFMLPAGVIIAMIVMSFYTNNITDIIMFGVLAFFSILRYYSVVEYRIYLDFKKYFMLFAIVTAGYFLGILVYILTDLWYMIFITGEALAVLVVFFTSKLFRGTEKSGDIKPLVTNLMLLVLSYILSESLNSLDKIILKNFVDAHAVAIYYVVSMIGKTLLFLTLPLNNLLLSYLARDKSTFTWDTFKKMLLIILVIDAVFYVFCLIGTPIYIKLLYPNLFAEIKGLNVVVNAAQILSFTSALVLVLILGILGSKYHLILQILYAVVFLPLSAILTLNYGLWGYAYAALFSGLIRFGQILLFTYKKLPKEKSKESVQVS